MTQAELRQAFYDAYGERSGKKTWDTASVNRILNTALRTHQKRYPMYLQTKALRVAEAVNEFTQAQVKPTLATGEQQVDINSVQYQKGEGGDISAIVGAAAGGASGGAKFTVTNGSNLDNNSRVQLHNLSSGNYTNGTYLAGVWDNDLLSIVQLSTSAVAVTAVADNGAGDASFTATAHGYLDDQVIMIYGFSEYTNGAYAIQNKTANTFELAASGGGLVNFVDTDTGNTKVCIDYDTSTDTGVWTDNSDNPRRVVTRDNWDEIQRLYSNEITPTSYEVPAGTAFINWHLVSDGIPTSGELADTEYPEVFQEFIAIEAARNAFLGTGDERALSLIQTRWAEFDQEIRKWSMRMVPRQEPLAGKLYYLNGVYAYRPQSDRAFIIRPRDF